MVEKALIAKKESKTIEFKQQFDVNSNADWLELIKDIVAMANSGGGTILIGVDDNGEPCGTHLSSVLSYDLAKVTDKIYSYTNTHFSDFEINPHVKISTQIAVISIRSVDIPIVFTKPGTYYLNEKLQGRAFSGGTLYFRHGAKSEPGTTEDIRQIFEQRLSAIREELMSGLRKVVEAPFGSQITILPPEVRQSESGNAIPIRIVDDPQAPAYRILDSNRTHPYRQTNLITEIRKRLPNKASFNTYDLFAIRKVHNIDEQEQYFFRPINGSPQYSQDFIEWIISSYEGDGGFFQKTREVLRTLRQPSSEV